MLIKANARMAVNERDAYGNVQGLNDLVFKNICGKHTYAAYISWCQCFRMILLALLITWRLIYAFNLIANMYFY